MIDTRVKRPDCASTWVGFWLWQIRAWAWVRVVCLHACLLLCVLIRGGVEWDACIIIPSDVFFIKMLPVLFGVKYLTESGLEWKKKESWKSSSSSCENSRYFFSLRAASICYLMHLWWKWCICDWRSALPSSCALLIRSRASCIVLRGGRRDRWLPVPVAAEGERLQQASAGWSCSVCWVLSSELHLPSISFSSSPPP